MATIKPIPSLADWEAHEASLAPTTTLIVSFFADWAAPCAQMSTVLAALASEYPADSPSSTTATSWVSVDAEELSDLSERFDVTAVPFLVIMRDGKVLETVSGSSAVKVREAVERHAGKPGGDGPAAAGTTSTTAGATEGGEVGDKKKEEEEDPAKKEEELFKRLAELVKAAPVMLFMKGTPSSPQCGFSRQLVAILRENAVKYGFFNILADEDVRQGLKKFADWPTYPQLWVKGELVGGLDIVSSVAYSTRPQSRTCSNARDFRRTGQGGDQGKPRLLCRA